ncbi:MAG: sigma-70 family RNA polymerase sigma factor [Candidatus Marinimicrobia bacterium]|nr:sigma-70 family RNA polymerase sigma factor [Candidatus Neomarinimicrobiota bacterium]
MEEIKLVKRAQAGNMMAFEQIVKNYEKRVFLIAIKIAKNEQDAEDIAQNVFITIFRKIDSFNFKSSFYSWLYRITMNTAFNHIKTRKYDEFLTNDDDDDKNLTITDDKTSEQTDDHSFQKILNDSLNKLPEKLKTVFIMKYNQHLKIKEIASILDLHSGTVKKYLFRANEKLRILLKPYREKMNIKVAL